MNMVKIFFGVVLVSLFGSAGFAMDSQDKSLKMPLRRTKSMSDLDSIKAAFNENSGIMERFVEMVVDDVTINSGCSQGCGIPVGIDDVALFVEWMLGLAHSVKAEKQTGDDSKSQPKDKK